MTLSTKVTFRQTAKTDGDGAEVERQAAKKQVNNPPNTLIKIKLSAVSSVFKKLKHTILCSERVSVMTPSRFFFGYYKVSIQFFINSLYD